MKRKLSLCLLTAGGLLAVISAGAAEMRLLSYNVCHCAADGGKTDVARVAETIRREQPDFAGLQDVDWLCNRSAVTDQAEEIAKALGFHATFGKEARVDVGWRGVVILSREEPRKKLELPLPGAESRVLLLCEFADCVVGTTQLPSAEADRKACLSAIRRVIGGFASGKPVFMTGDFGASAGSDLRDAIGDFQTVKSVDRTPVTGELRIPDERPSSPCVVPRPSSVQMGEAYLRLRRSSVDETIWTSAETDPSVPKEGYRLTIDAQGVRVVAADAAGRFYALQTVRQLAGFSGGRLSLPYCEIVDAPRFGWRGVLFDDVRHFMGKAAVKRTMDLMAEHKLNVFHWHLTDDQGWRVPIPAYPQLTAVGAARPYSTCHKDLADRFEDGTYGPFSYTAEDLREIAAYARARHIRIVPEIDFPAHSHAAIRAYPGLRCVFTDGNRPADVHEDVFCLGNDETLALFRAVFDEVARLLPDCDLIQIGGDEVPTGNWEACPRCQARMRALGITQAADLQVWMTAEIARHLKKLNRRVVIWDHIGVKGMPDDAIVMRWCDQKDWSVPMTVPSVMTPHTECYFDYDQGLPDDPATYPWFTFSLPLSRVYAYDPLVGIPAEQRRNVMGGQCCNWSEYTCNETELQWKLWPRACATAEVFWSQAENRDYGDFLKRMEVHRRRLIRHGVNCAPLR